MLVLACAFLGALASVVSASQPVCNEDVFQLENERRSEFVTEDYVFDIARALDQSDGQSVSFNAGVSPALFGTFISSVLIDFKPCYINLPHTHPRATEISLVLEGELLMGFAEENGG